MSLKETGELKKLNTELNALYMEQDDLYSAYAAHFGLSDTAFWILYSLCEDDCIKTQNELAKTFHMPPQSINSAAMGLVKRGILRLEQLSGVRSGKALCLTEAGKAFCDRVVYPFFRMEENALAVLDEKERAQYLDSMRRVIAAVRAGVADATR